MTLEVTIKFMNEESETFNLMNKNNEGIFKIQTSSLKASNNSM